MLSPYALFINIPFYQYVETGHRHQRFPQEGTGTAHSFSEAEFLELLQPLAERFLQSFLPGLQGGQHVLLGGLGAIRFLRTCQ